MRCERHRAAIATGARSHPAGETCHWTSGELCAAGAPNHRGCTSLKSSAMARLGLAKIHRVARAVDVQPWPICSTRCVFAIARLRSAGGGRCRRWADRATALAAAMLDAGVKAIEYRRKLSLDVGERQVFLVKQISALLAVPLQSVELAGPSSALDNQTYGAGRTLRRMRDARRQAAESHRRVSADRESCRSRPPEAPYRLRAGGKTLRPDRRGNRVAALGPPTAITINSLSSDMSLLPTGGLSSERCSSIQRRKFSGSRVCIRLYYVDETLRLINLSKLAYGTQTRAFLATVRCVKLSRAFRGYCRDYRHFGIFAASSGLVSCWSPLGAGLGGCSHMQHLWPWHHAPAALRPPANELVVVAGAAATPAGAPADLGSQCPARRPDRPGRRRATCRLRPGAGPRLADSARICGAARLVQAPRSDGEQRVIMSVPDSGAVRYLAGPQGTYAARPPEACAALRTVNRRQRLRTETTVAL